MKNLILLMALLSTPILAETIPLKDITGNIEVIVDKKRGIVCYLYNHGTWSSEGNTMSCVKLEKKEE